MEEIGNYILSALVGGGGVYGLFTWLGKTWVNKRVSKELDNHREELKRTTNEMQEKLRIEYGTVYGIRLKVIANIYEQLAYIEMLMLVKDKIKFSEKEIIEINNKLSEKIGKCTMYCSENGLYLTDALKEKLSKLIDLCAFSILGLDEQVKDRLGQELKEQCKEINHSDIVEPLTEIRKEFQILLGIK